MGDSTTISATDNGRGLTPQFGAYSASHGLSCAARLIAEDERDPTSSCDDACRYLPGFHPACHRCCPADSLFHVSADALAHDRALSWWAHTGGNRRAWPAQRFLHRCGRRRSVEVG